MQILAFVFNTTLCGVHEQLVASDLKLNVIYLSVIKLDYQPQIIQNFNVN